MVRVCLIAVCIFMAPLPQRPATTLRQQLVRAVNSSKTTDSLYQSFISIKDRTPLITGYIATLQALKAKHTWNPYCKIKYLNDSEKTFAQAVTADPHEMEVRFLRFSVEHNVPAFLGDNKNLYSDREEIIDQLEKKHYIQADKPLIITIIKFLLNSKRCTAAENAYLTKALILL
jgi:hypothetical protein